MATSNNFEFFRGEDRVQPFYANPEQNIAGWTIEFYIFDPHKDEVLVTKTLGSGITSLDDTVGQLTVTFLAANTDDLPKRIYYYELWRTNAGYNTLLSYGDIRLLS